MLAGLGGQVQLSVKTSPGLIIDEPPTMTRAGCIGSQQYLTWTQHKCFTVAGYEFECTRE
jgi:hypothetical protein